MKPHPRTIYGRQQSRPLSPAKQALLERCLPNLLVSPSYDQGQDLSTPFSGESREVWIEIGFGGGEHLLHQAKANPHIGFIGCEPFLNGLAHVVQEIERSNIKNIRLYNGDAREILEGCADQSIGRIFLLFPDPWPKKRHHKRRFVNPHNLSEINRILKKGGELRIGSDIKDYVDWTLCHIKKVSRLEFCAAQAEDWRIRPEDWPATRYEAKALREGRKPAYMRFLKT